MRNGGAAHKNQKRRGVLIALRAAHRHFERSRGSLLQNGHRLMGGSTRETLIKSLSDFILGFLYRARNHLTRIASYLRKMMTKLCIKIHMKSDSAI